MAFGKFIQGLAFKDLLVTLASKTKKLLSKNMDNIY